MEILKFQHSKLLCATLPALRRICNHKANESRPAKKVTTGIGKTGVVGTLTCGNGEGSIAIRSDMDSLKIDEKSDHDHVSENPGRMHACGHDGHMATLLGAAEMILEAKDFSGTVHFIFQWLV